MTAAEYSLGEQNLDLDLDSKSKNLDCDAPSLKKKK